jgi:hypothetical protein
MSTTAKRGQRGENTFERYTVSGVNVYDVGAKTGSQSRSRRITSLMKMMKAMDMRTSMDRDVVMIRDVDVIE